MSVNIENQNLELYLMSDITEQMNISREKNAFIFSFSPLQKKSTQ